MCHFDFVLTCIIHDKYCFLLEDMVFVFWQYIHPSDYGKLGQAELVCVDEAAAIPIPLVRKVIGPYLVFLSSTTSGYVLPLILYIFMWKSGL